MSLRSKIAGGCLCCALGLLLHPSLHAAAPDDQQYPAAAVQQPTTSTDAHPIGQPVFAPTEGKLSRWLDMNTISFSLRYRSTHDENGASLFQFGQQRSLIDGKLKLDSQGKYAINFHVSSGRYFNWAYADVIGGSFADRAGASVSRFPLPLLIAAGQATSADPKGFQQVSAGTVSRGWEMYARQLYFSASPVKQVSFEYGSMPIDHGANSEITTYDDDGYMSGGRLSLKDPDHLFFDRMSATFGFVGDIFIPNVFARGDSFVKSNYHQFLLEKKLTGRLDATVDWTEHFGAHTWREGLLAKIPETKVLDSARLELYQRTNAINLSGETFAGGNGFAISGTKDLFKKTWHVEGGYADVDRNYAVYTGNRFMTVVGHSINGDGYAMGNRFFGRAAYKPSQYLTFFGYYTHVVNTNFMTLNRETVYGGAEVNVKNALNSAFHLF